MAVRRRWKAACPMNPLFFWFEGMREREQAGSLPLTLASLPPEREGAKEYINNRNRPTCGQPQGRCSQVGERGQICADLRRKWLSCIVLAEASGSDPAQNAAEVGQCERGVPTTPNPSEGLQLGSCGVYHVGSPVPTTPNPSEGLQLLCGCAQPEPTGSQPPPTRPRDCNSAIRLKL